MENQNESSKNAEQGKNPANLNDHPQNASGKPGKEFSSDQKTTEFDQSEESASHLNQPHGMHQPQNPASSPNQPARENTPERADSNPSNEFTQPNEKQPIDRQTKKEDQELL